jgi:hypothetical protein
MHRSALRSRGRPEHPMSRMVTGHALPMGRSMCRRGLTPSVGTACLCWMDVKSGRSEPGTTCAISEEWRDRGPGVGRPLQEPGNALESRRQRREPETEIPGAHEGTCYRKFTHMSQAHNLCLLLFFALGSWVSEAHIPEGRRP